MPPYTLRYTPQIGDKIEYRRNPGYTCYIVSIGGHYIVKFANGHTVSWTRQDIAATQNDKMWRYTHRYIDLPEGL